MTASVLNNGPSKDGSILYNIKPSLLSIKDRPKSEPISKFNHLRFKSENYPEIMRTIEKTNCDYRIVTVQTTSQRNEEEEEEEEEEDGEEDERISPEIGDRILLKTSKKDGDKKRKAQSVRTTSPRSHFSSVAPSLYSTDYMFVPRTSILKGSNRKIDDMGRVWIKEPDLHDYSARSRSPRSLKLESSEAGSSIGTGGFDASFR